jgi:sRNA-binding regulator protein Hfq
MAYGTYLINLIESKTKVKIFLGNKVMLTGIIVHHDDLCIIVEKDKISPKCMVIREQIASIMPE